MVKFSLIALASAFATAAAGPVRKTIKLGDRKMRRGDPATEALLLKARPFKRGARKLANDDAFEIDGTYSLKFDQCVDLRTYDEDLFGEDVVAYAQAGQAVATKSFVLFHVCQGDNCYYDSDEDLYIVDLATYLTNVANFYANQRMDYCEACGDFEDTCNPEEEEAAEEEEGAEEEEDAAEEEAEGEEGEGEGEEEGEEEGGRKLAKKQRKLAKKQRRTANYIDCDQCLAWNCYEDEENMDDGQQKQEEIDRDISDFVMDLAGCEATGQYLGNNALYVGPICSPYGDGVELAVFLDEECSIYTNQKAFGDVFDPSYNADENRNANIDYMTYAENYIKTAFSSSMSCLKAEYDDPNEENNGDEEEEKYEVNDYCKEIMEGGAVDYNNCQGGNAEEQQQADDYYSWYEYDISAQNAEDLDEVCYALQKMEGEFYHAYDEEGSGTWYQRNKQGQIVYGDEKQQKKGGLSGGAIFGIILLCLAVVGGAGFVLTKKNKQGSNSSSNYQGGTLS